MGYIDYELNGDETLVKLTRRHWITLVVPLAKAAVSLLLAVMVLQAVEKIAYASQIAFIWILASIIYAVYVLWIWSLDCYIITDRKLVDIDQQGLFKRQVTEAEWKRVQEVIYETSGVLQAVFNYGTVKISLAANGGIIAMEKVPKPKEIKNIISKIQYGN